MPGPYTLKESVIRGNAALQGKRLSDLQRACTEQLSVSRHSFYAVVRGDRQSERIDQFIADELGIKLETLRNEQPA